MASTKWIVDLNLDGNELQNAVVQNLGTAPANPKAGQIWYDTSTNLIYFHDGTVNKAVGYLPIASAETLGGIKVGSHLTINPTTGVLSVDEASDSVKGVIEIATDVEAAAETSTVLAVNPKQLSVKVNKLSVKPTAGTYTKVTINNEGQVTTGTSLASLDVTTALGYTPVPDSRTINGEELTADIVLGPAEVGALPDTTTIYDLTSTAQAEALDSGATSTLVNQITTNQNDISTINGKIPSQASTSNQLADKAFVNSTVQTNTANFRGNWETWQLVPTNANDYPEDYSGSKTPTVNDYMVVQDASGYTRTAALYAWYDSTESYGPVYTLSATPDVGDNVFSEDDNVFVIIGSVDAYTSPNMTFGGYTLTRDSQHDESSATVSECAGTWRFKYSGTWATEGKNGWLPEYRVNETPMTAAQIAAINSGITSTLVAQITTNQNDIDYLQRTYVTASSTDTFTNKTIDAEGTGNSITNLKTTNFKSGVIVTTVGSTGTDTSLPTEQAVREALTALDNSVVHKITATNTLLAQSGGLCTWTIANTLATGDVSVNVYEVSTGEEVFTDVTTTANSVVIKINSETDIAAGTYRAVIIG